MTGRTGVLFLTWAALLASGTATQEPSLRAVAEHAGLLVGAAARPAQLSEPNYASTLAREFSMLQPEDALKWEVVHPQPESFDFQQADRLLTFAIAHNMKVRGHTLVWHRQNPKWLTEGTYTPNQLARILEQHIKTVVGHYRGKIFAWDVVNEAFDEIQRGKLRSTLWRDQPGIGQEQRVTNDEARAATDRGSAVPEARPEEARAEPSYAYIERCFRWAHEADPQALLFYNDAEAEEVNSKSDAIYRMVEDFRRRGVPIDGVGLQMHVPNLRADVASISANIQRFTALGLQIHITEMDVALPVDSNGNARPDDEQSQTHLYREIAAACVSHPGCTAIQTWGFTDKYSWIGSHSQHKQGAALLFDRNYQPKPAYSALKNLLAQTGRR